jgi:hypothetical protein
VTNGGGRNDIKGANARHFFVLQAEANVLQWAASRVFP